ncbi:MAG TPA: hypothetical protein VEB66_13665 [Opitutaceae bacterium]|nr:hypothetical protein [Opitutaceae bacterium]
MLPLPSFLRRSTPGVTGSEHPSASSLQMFSVVAGPVAPATAAGNSRPPLGDLRLAESLDEFHALVRRHQVDRVYVDLLDLSVADGMAACHVILSASKGGVDLLARLPWPGDKTASGVAPVDPVTYRNVLRSRFLFLGYSVSDGLASARLARHLEHPSHQAGPAAKTA